MAEKSKKAPSAAVLKYATTVARSSLREGRPHVELREYGQVTVSYYAGLPFSAYWFDDEEIVFRFRRPNYDTVRAEKAKYFAELTTPTNWLEYRRPLSRDPRPDLESKSGQVMGSAFFEFSQGQIILERLDLEAIKAPHTSPDKSSCKAPRSICSEGGPFIALPQSRLSNYPGYDDEVLNEKIFRAATEEGNLAELGFGLCLLLATPELLYWFPNDSGGLLVRISSWDTPDEERLAKDMAEIDDQDWTPIEGTLLVTEPWYIFDAALEGPSAMTEALTLDLPTGNYSLASRLLSGDDFEFLLVRFCQS